LLPSWKALSGSMIEKRSGSPGFSRKLWPTATIRPLRATARSRWVCALIGAVNKKTGDSKRTIERRIGALVDQGALERIGAGPSTAYNATGLV
jgi:hypothetical protein